LNQPQTGPVPSEERSQVSDARLVSRFVAGEEKAFDEIVRRYQERVFSFAFRMLQDFDQADDVAQETFVRAYQKLGRFRGDSTLFTWLYRIAYNLSINCLRKKKLWSFISGFGAGADSPMDEIPAPRGPEEELNAYELRLQVDAAIGTLPSRQRSIFVLRHFQELSHRQIAGILGCSEGAVRAGYFHAVKKLQAALREWL